MVNNNVTLFISVRKGLENCLLNEIKRNKLLNNINRIHYKKNREFTIDSLEERYTHNIFRDTDNIDIKSLNVHDNHIKWLKRYDVEGNINKINPSVNKNNVYSTVNERVNCDLTVQPGGIEVKCNRNWLINSVNYIKSAESIWLRIGNPFRCQTEGQFIEFASKLPWHLYISRDSIDEIQSRIITRNSNLWSSHIISKCLRESLKLSFELNDHIYIKSSDSRKYSCISVNINRNTCYIALQYSSRFSPRIYNYSIGEIEESIDSNGGFDYQSQVPYWSLAELKKSVNLDYFSKSTYSPCSIIDRDAFIKHQRLISEDNYDTADSVLAGFLQNNELYKDLISSRLIWDPFCGNGNLVCEVLALLLNLPNFNVVNTSSFNEIQTHDKREIVASDVRIIMLNEAKIRLLKFQEYYKNFTTSDVITSTSSVISNKGTLFESFSSFPVNISIHKSSIENLSHNLLQPLILTKIPYTKGLDNSSRIKLYKTFGQVIGSRSDLKRVYVISRKRGFEYYSGLEWKVISKCNNSKGDVIKLLKWTGISRHFKFVEDRITQLDEFDLL